MNVSNLVKIGFLVGVMGMMTGCGQITKPIIDSSNNNLVTEVVVSSRDKIKTDGTVAINIDINTSEKGGHVFNSSVIKENLEKYLAKKDIKLDDSSPNKYTLKILSFTAVEPSQYKKANGESIGSLGSMVTGQNLGSSAGVIAVESILEKTLSPQDYLCTTTYQILDKNQAVKTSVSVTSNPNWLKNLVKDVNTYYTPMSASEFFVK
ncbi:MAG: hypothetical protein K0U21_08645 [Proteobacteria bacterium]|nr:hypothetical protein [Pseudomonadota bacterium]